MVNIKTGQTINDKSKLEDVSEALKEVTFKIKEYQAIEDYLKNLMRPHIIEAWNKGEKKLENFWTISNGAMRFDKAKFEAEADDATRKEYDVHKDAIKTIEDSFKKQGDPFIKVPKL